MKRSLLAAAVAGALVFGPVARAATHQATVGNYYFEDDQQRDRTKITVRQGDQITFTVRQAAYPPHTVDVDELDIHSPGLLVGQTFTTPPLNKPGTFNLYCRPHEARGHRTRLIVQAAAAATPKATSRATDAPGQSAAAPPVTSASVSATPSSSPTASSAPSLAPVGVGTAPPGSLQRTLTPDPDSLEALTGVQRSNQVPWTRAVWWLLLASVPIVGAAGLALRRNAVLHAAAVAEAARAAEQERPAKRRKR
jgi:plastocyanin